MRDFVKVLKEINSLIIFKSYSARENEIIGGRAKDLHLHLPNSFYAENVNDIIDYIKDYSYTFDCIVILGAGDLAIDIKNILNKPKWHEIVGIKVMEIWDIYLFICKNYL